MDRFGPQLLALVAVFATAALAEEVHFSHAACPDFDDFGFTGPCQLVVDERIYDVYAGGHGLATLEDGHTAFQIPVPASGRVGGYRIAETEGGLLLVVDYSFVDSGAAAIALLDRESLEVVWITNIPTFNVRPTIRDNHAYLSGAGFVAKVRLETGNYVWERNDLYDSVTYSFGLFDEPLFDGDRVVFPDASAPGDAPRKRIVVDDRTGELSIEAGGGE